MSQVVVTQPGFPHRCPQERFSTVKKMTIEIPSLGRPFSLGMLYDCRDDKLIPGMTFWKREALERNVCVTPQNNTCFETLASDTVSDKTSALKISASLKVSFLCGLISVGGSATYLNDVKTSRKQARVTLKYSRTTRFEQLSMDHLCTENMTYQNVFDNKIATHVVTGILYGAQAFFIFDQEVSSSENPLNIQGKLESMIMKIPQTVGVPQIAKAEKELVRKFNCTFHGDFALERNPVNYEDAIKIYTSLPHLIGPKGEKAVPVRVWLYPLRNLDNKSAQLIREVSDGLVFRAENIIQQLAEVNMQCNDMMRHQAAKTFPDIKKKIIQFREQCMQFTLIFQKQLAHILLSIRSGETEEDALLDILCQRENSPFGKLHIEHFLSKKQMEMDFVRSHLDVLPDITVLPTEHKLNEVIIDQTTEYTMSYNFASLNEDEPYLVDINEWLHNKKYLSRDVYENSKAPQWYEDIGRAKKARRCVKEFQAFANANSALKETQFVVSSVHDQSRPGVSIYLFECGELVSTEFEPPSKPNLPIITKKTHDSIELRLRPADSGKESIESYKIEYSCSGTDSWMSLNTKNIQKDITVTGLKPNSYYKFRYSAVSKPGLSVLSADTSAEKTLPTGPPGTPWTTAQPNAVNVIWTAPDMVGDGVTIEEYTVQYREQNESKWLEKRTGSKDEKCGIQGLKINTTYKVRVCAICGDAGVGAPSDENEFEVPEEGITDKAQSRLMESTLLSKGQPSIYQLNVAKSGYQQYNLGMEKPQTTNKVILLIGATGSGKTTLINGMANYILGVSWTDGFRFKLTHRTHSPTPDITVYKVNHEARYNVPYTLTLIDVPGFGDVHGVTQARNITEAVHAFLTSESGIHQIDAVCFVVPASSSWMTQTQKYIFKSLFSIFGKDLKDNIMILVTFADAGRPPILDAIKAADMPCPLDSNGDPVHFKFNNSALFASNKQGAASINTMFWKVGEQSIAAFLRALGRSESRSLRLSKELLRERKALESSLLALQLQGDTALAALVELKDAKKNLQHNMDVIAANIKYEYEREVEMESITALNDVIINCSQCEFICHFPCACEVTDVDMSKCSAMDKKGKCTTCPQKCKWQDHYIEKHATNLIMMKEMETDWGMKLKYEAASAGVTAVNERIHELERDYAVIRERVSTITRECQQHETIRSDLALGLDPLLCTEDIDILIRSEELESRPGYQNRVQELKAARSTAGLREQVLRCLDVLCEQEAMLDDYME